VIHTTERSKESFAALLNGIIPRLAISD
jgi:hypothetical protein